jgi:hypothetical protein
LAKSYRKQAANRVLGAAKIAERRKNLKYLARVEAERAEFFPFIVETFGGFGNKARELIKVLAAHSEVGSDLWSPADISSGIKRDVQDSLIWGNLRIMTVELGQCHPLPGRRALRNDCKRSTNPPEYAINQTRLLLRRTSDKAIDPLPSPVRSPSRASSEIPGASPVLSDQDGTELDTPSSSSPTPSHECPDVSVGKALQQLSSPASRRQSEDHESSVGENHTSSDDGITSTMDTVEREYYASPEQNVSWELDRTPSMESLMCQSEEDTVLSLVYPDDDLDGASDVTVELTSPHASVDMSVRE